MEDQLAHLAPKRRRRHSPQFKAQVVQACKEPGVSVAAVALHYQVNANLVRRWLSCGNAVATNSSGCNSRMPALPEFIPLQGIAAAPAQSSQEIVVEVRRGQATATVRWPITASGECATWLQSWLR